MTATATVGRYLRLDAGLPARLCRLMILFAVQGVVVLVGYAIIGFGAIPEDLPYGLQLDPRHAVLHLATGVVSGIIGFARPAWAVWFLRLFGIFYLALAVFGTFTSHHFGLELELPENALHWTIGGLALIVGFHPATGGSHAQ